MDKTIVYKCGRFSKASTIKVLKNVKLKAHDENNRYSVGDIVGYETRPGGIKMETCELLKKP